MKTSTKFLLAAAALICTGVSLSAQNNSLIRENSGKKDAIYLVSGDAACLNAAGEVCAVKVDFSEAKIVSFDKKMNIKKDYGTLEEYNASQGTAYEKSWPHLYELMEGAICHSMSQNFKTEFKRQSTAENAKYLMVVKPGIFDFGHAQIIGGSKDGGAVAKGLVDLYDSNGNLLAEFDMNYLRGTNIGVVVEIVEERLTQFGNCFMKAMKNALK